MCCCGEHGRASGGQNHFRRGLYGVDVRCAPRGGPRHAAIVRQPQGERVMRVGGGIGAQSIAVAQHQGLIGQHRHRAGERCGGSAQQPRVLVYATAWPRACSCGRCPRSGTPRRGLHPVLCRTGPSHTAPPWPVVAVQERAHEKGPPGGGGGPPGVSPAGSTSISRRRPTGGGVVFPFLIRVLEIGRSAPRLRIIAFHGYLCRRWGIAKGAALIVCPLAADVPPPPPGRRNALPSRLTATVCPAIGGTCPPPPRQYCPRPASHTAEGGR